MGQRQPRGHEQFQLYRAAQMEGMGTGVAVSRCGNKKLLAVVDYETTAPPAQERLMKVKLLPPLQLTSCLPCHWA